MNCWAIVVCSSGTRIRADDSGCRTLSRARLRHQAHLDESLLLGRAAANQFDGLSGRGTNRLVLVLEACWRAGTASLAAGPKLPSPSAAP